MGMTARALENAFRSKKGITVLLFVQQQRMEKAKIRLLSTTDRIAEISYDVGYPDHSYFSRVFKRATGKTPNEFRKSHQYNFSLLLYLIISFSNFSWDL
jgi:AraC-like DNA-binding protein